LPAEHPAVVQELVQEAVNVTGSIEAAAAAAGTTSTVIRALAGQAEAESGQGKASDG
jgi:hypothetical protein